MRNQSLQHSLLFFLIALQSFTVFAQAQSDSKSKNNEKYINWHNKDLSTQQVPGISTERAYEELLKSKESHPVTVAVIDGGVDTAHEDLRANLWTNEGEIPGNGIDDDKNGYVDDIHGWNFLGNAKGENISHETLELTRVYKMYADRFGDKTEKQVAPADREEYYRYQAVAKDYLKQLMESKQEQIMYESFTALYNRSDSTIKHYLKKDTYTEDELKAIKAFDAEVNEAAQTLISLKTSGFTPEDIEEAKKEVDQRAYYYLNPDFTTRRDIIGDDPEKLKDMAYGNNDVTGPDASHGTFVSGIIGAVRNNALGVDGIADNVKIMALRAVPDGDERDKDIANAIHYAVDNGATIINMSFGKSYSPQKALVDEAFHYAASKSVLLVHAAGNDAKNIDEENNFPAPLLLNGTTVDNVITVGANSKNLDKTFIADFSNYGRKSLDIFAPGVSIYGLKPGNKYDRGNGTSYAGPMVAGVAALLKSYYPNLSAVQLKSIIMDSGSYYGKLRVYVPSENGKRRKKKLYKLSVTGSELNAYNAVKLAQSRSGIQ